MKPATTYRRPERWTEMKTKVADTRTSKWMCGVTMTLDRIRNESILRDGSGVTTGEKRKMALKAKTGRQDSREDK